MNQIKNRFTGEVIAKSETATIAELATENKANLTGANLYMADLTRADLTKADLTKADLTRANLTGANLTKADLTEADLTRANLTRANLYMADLHDANLTGANLTGANLYMADLHDANLYMADLTRANLTKANLTGADLTKANLTKADLTEADLREAKISWTSHHLISEILYRAAITDEDAKIQVEKRKVAGLIAISTDWCWTEFIALNDPLTDWAISVLAPYAENDPNAPIVFKQKEKINDEPQRLRRTNPTLSLSR